MNKMTMIEIIVVIVFFLILVSSFKVLSVFFAFFTKISFNNTFFYHLLSAVYPQTNQVSPDSYGGYALPYGHTARL